ncbi:MAG TPA: hypothetical protein EYN69_04215 [Flavobacteriales bacterium]|nr:hypothetical protein [Flavobacteriales bacterium]
MGKVWKRHTHHKRWLAARGEEEAPGVVAATPAQEAQPAPEAPVVEAPVEAVPKKKTRRSARKSTK